MTARFGTWDRLLIRLSVSPSLRYSVLGSLPALTKGRTASEEISCWLLRRRDRKTAAATSASIKATARPATQRRLPEAGTASDPETRIWGAVALPTVDVGAAPTVVDICAATGVTCSIAATTALRLDSVSLFRRCSSARISDACW